jgi:phosphohistidine phosphatase SixA
VRHAHRDTSLGRERDNGLSPKGEKQADLFTKWATRDLPLDSTVVASSPKRRCFETVDALRRPVRIWASLGEQQAKESDAAYHRSKARSGRKRRPWCFAATATGSRSRRSY